MAICDLPDMYALSPQVLGIRIRQIPHGYVIGNIAMGDLPDMYAQGPRTAGSRAEGIHIRQIMNGYVATIMYHFVPIVTTPILCKVISTNCYNTL